MLKIAGGLLILAGGFLVRHMQMKERQRKRAVLSDLLCALRRLCEEIRCTKCPMPRLLERLGNACGGDAAQFFLSVAKASADGTDVSKTWETAALQLPISKESIAALVELGQDLRGDEEQICNAISLVMLRISREAEKMDADFRADGQRISALCFSSAALLVILLI